MGPKRVDDLLKAIENSKNRPLWRIIHALGIRYVGKKTSKIIEEAILRDLFEKYGEKIDEVVKSFGWEELIKYFKDLEFLHSIY